MIRWLPASVNIDRLIELIGDTLDKQGQSLARPIDLHKGDRPGGGLAEQLAAGACRAAASGRPARATIVKRRPRQVRSLRPGR
jgi:hypothetical protein